MEFQILDASLKSRIDRGVLVPIIRLFGRRADGTSVSADVAGITFYFYASRWPNDFTELLNNEFAKKHERMVEKGTCKCLKHGGSNARDQAVCTHTELPSVKDVITKVTRVKANGFVGYEAEPKTYYKIHVSHPTFIRPIMWAADRLAEEKLGWFEAHVSAVDRFFVDHQLTGCGWIRLENATPAIGTTRCVKDYRTDVQDVRRLDCDANAPLRTLAIDCEMLALTKGKFPTFEEDPVIQIATVRSVYGDQSQDEVRMFMLKSCEPIEGVLIHTFDDEAEMLVAFRDYMVQSDIDVVSGYNSNVFDLPYLFKRAEILGVKKAFYDCTREAGRMARFRESIYESKQSGSRLQVQWTIPGIVCFDVLDAVRANYKLRSYKLDDVAKHFLKDQMKDPMPYTQIPILQNGTARDRAKLARYCVQDTRLVQLLTDKLQLLVASVELSKVVGCLLNSCLTRGQSFKVGIKIMHAVQGRNILVPTFGRNKTTGDTIVPYYRSMGASFAGGDGVAFKGATVIEPKRGYYTQPTAVLDFASLYPSIMCFHNLSHDTLLKDRAHARSVGLSDADVTETPNGFLFAKASVKKGILSTILEDLLGARKRARKQKKEAKTPFDAAVYDAKQLALKVCCNSVYGFTGASVGSLPCLMISAGVTAFGRQMIDDSSEFMAKHYGCDTVYGDTDSVFVQFPSVEGESADEARHRAYDLARQAEKHINGPDGIFHSPILLEYEKTFQPFLLLGKKRYSARKYEFDMDQFKLDYTGIELKRRDNALILGQTQREYLNALLIDQDYVKALKSVEKNVKGLLSRNVPMEQLVISKKLAKQTYASAQIHVNLNERIRARSPALVYALGDRIPYVVIEDGSKDVSKRGEDPQWVQGHPGLKLDLTYYLEKQVRNPMKRLITPIIGEKAFENWWSRTVGGAADRFFNSSLRGFIPPMLTDAQMEARRSADIRENSRKLLAQQQRKRKREPKNPTNVQLPKRATLLSFFKPALGFAGGV